MTRWSRLMLIHFLCKQANERLEQKNKNYEWSQKYLSFATVCCPVLRALAIWFHFKCQTMYKLFAKALKNHKFNGGK